MAITSMISTRIQLIDQTFLAERQLVLAKAQSSLKCAFLGCHSAPAGGLDRIATSSFGVAASGLRRCAKYNTSRAIGAAAFEPEPPCSTTTEIA